MFRRLVALEMEHKKKKYIYIWLARFNNGVWGQNSTMDKLVISNYKVSFLVSWITMSEANIVVKQNHQYFCIFLLCCTQFFLAMPHSMWDLNALTRDWTQGWASLVAQTVKNLPAMQETQVWSLGQEDLLEKGMATYFSILA